MFYKLSYLIVFSLGFYGIRGNEYCFVDQINKELYYCPVFEQDIGKLAQAFIFDFEYILNYAKEHKTGCNLFVYNDLNEKNPFGDVMKGEASRTAITWASIYKRFFNLDINVFACNLDLSEVYKFDWKNEILLDNKLSYDIKSFSKVKIVKENHEEIVFKTGYNDYDDYNDIYLITGGAGFIGSHLINELIKLNKKIIVMDNLSCCEGTKNIQKFIDDKSIVFVDHDVTIPFGFDCKVSTIIHLASVPSPEFYYNMPIETIKSGIHGTRNCVDLAVKHNSRFIFASTSEVYGDPKVSPQPEDYSGNVSFCGKRSQYDQSKRFSETLIYSYAQKYKLDVRIARIFNTYGPNMRLADGRVVTNFIKASIEGLPLMIYGSGNQTRSFGYVSDTVDGLIKLIMLPEQNFISDEDRVINIGSEEEYTINELADMIKYIFLENYHKTLTVELKVNPDPYDPKLRRPLLNKAKKFLGYEPKVKINEGLLKTIKFFVE